MTEVKKSKIKWTKIGDLEWSKNLGEMTWDEAVVKCKELGGRLPTRAELVDLVDNYQDKIKDWGGVYYWSSTQDYNTPSGAWSVYLNRGTTSIGAKTLRAYVSAIRKS